LASVEFYLTRSSTLTQKEVIMMANKDTSLTSEEKQAMHNKGQQDASKGQYRPPNGAVRLLFGNRREVEEGVAYDEGHKNTQQQKGS